MTAKVIPLDTREAYEKQREEIACRYTHYCPRCQETYLEEGECAWCPGHVQLYALSERSDR